MLLSRASLAHLRSTPDRDYCRECDEFFAVGDETHERHRTYADFDGVSESTIPELEVQYRREGRLG